MPNDILNIIPYLKSGQNAFLRHNISCHAKYHLETSFLSSYATLYAIIFKISFFLRHGILMYMITFFKSSQMVF